MGEVASFAGGYICVSFPLQVPEKCVEVAVLMQKSGDLPSEWARLSSEEVQLGIQRQKERNTESSQ